MAFQNFQMQKCVANHYFIAHIVKWGGVKMIYTLKIEYSTSQEDIVLCRVLGHTP